jgi:hypothetical protein
MAMPFAMYVPQVFPTFRSLFPVSSLSVPDPARPCAFGAGLRHSRPVLARQIQPITLPNTRNSGNSSVVTVTRSTS